MIFVSCQSSIFCQLLSPLFLLLQRTGHQILFHYYARVDFVFLEHRYSHISQMIYVRQLSKYWSTTSLIVFELFHKLRLLSVFQVTTKVKRLDRKRLPFAVVVPTVIRVTPGLLGPFWVPQHLWEFWPLQWCILIGHVLGIIGQDQQDIGHPPQLGKRTGLKAYWAPPIMGIPPWVRSRVKMGRALFLGRSLWLMPVSALLKVGLGSPGKQMKNWSLPALASFSFVKLVTF